MTTPMRNRMRRHTRPATYVSKARQAEAVVSGRPGARSFSFHGEFPDLGDYQPVEATGRRRNYTSGHQTGSYHAIRQDETSRMPVISKYGVHYTTALAMLAVLVVFLGSILFTQLDQRSKLLSAIQTKETRIGELTVKCSNTRDDINLQSNDVNIRQEAVRLGLISAKGVAVEYLEAPTDAVITLQDQTVVQSLASIWGR